MPKPELLAPAGNMEKLQIAIRYGADAVYLGGGEFNLRGQADNFSLSEMAAALEYCRNRDVKAYLTINSYPHNGALERLEDYLGEVASLPFDAYIIADPGALELARKTCPQRALHLSTQANTTNWLSAAFWKRQGFSRVNLARETTLEAVSETVALAQMEVELFVHGAMCVSYSGRCLLSAVMTGRNANQGDCSHPCRWNYHLVEEQRPGEYFPALEDNSGTFIFNSRDLCLLEYLPQIVSSGAASLKIEGRMKGVNYVASVLRVYRRALDEYLNDPEHYHCRPEWMEELSKLSHRGYTTGFLFGAPRDVGQEYHSAYVRTHEFAGIVETTNEDGSAIVGVRNRIQRGDTLELIGPDMRSEVLRMDELLLIGPANEIRAAQSANPNQRVFIRPPFRAECFDLLRREKPQAP